MAHGNKGFAGLVSGSGGAGLEPRSLPRMGILGARENRLGDLARGELVTRVHEAIDPALCRIWGGHNRDYAALNETVCADLIDSLRAQGRQEVPAIVRRVPPDEGYQFEVICGARRHWSVSWLRAHDEEAFRVADLENRSRKDLSDYERAMDYARAIERYYEGSQQRMADRLQVTKSWLSRYLELARLPPELLNCFESPHVIGISHAAAIAPLLGRPLDAKLLWERAAELVAVQAQHRADGLAPIKPSEVVARLTNGKATKPAATSRPTIKINDHAGKLLLLVRTGIGGAIDVSIPADRLQDRSIVLTAIEELMKANHKEPMKKVRSPPRARQGLTET
jgi:ParB family chromosome partitioning protein